MKQADEIYAHAMGIKLDEPIPEPQARHPSQADLWRETAYAWKAQSDTWEARSIEWEARCQRAVKIYEEAEADANAAWCVAGVLEAVALAAVIWGATR